MKFILANALSFACLAAMIVLGIVMYPGLPETIATQYNFEGVAGNYTPKLLVVLVMPISYAASIVVVNLMIHFSPEKFAMTNSLRAMDIMVFSVGLLLLISHAGMMVSLGDADIFHQYFAVGMASFLIISGNVIGKTERNFIFGIRLPWTVATMENWRATHRLAGKLMVISGLLLLPLSFFWPSLLMNLTLGLSWLPMASVHSFVFYLKNERNRENKEGAS